MKDWMRAAALAVALGMLLPGCGRGQEREELMDGEFSAWEDSSGMAHEEEGASEKSRSESSWSSEPASAQDDVMTEDASSTVVEEPSSLPEELSSSTTPATPEAPVSSTPPQAASDTGPSRAEVAGEQDTAAGDGGTTLRSGESSSAAGGASAGSAVLSAVEQGVVSLINTHRAELGLGVLRVDGNLTAAARIRSRELYDHGYFAHTRPDGSGWQSVLQVDVPTAYSMAGENLAMVEHNLRDRDPAAEPGYWYEVWKNSPGHYENMVRAGYTRVGVGVVRIEEDGMIYAYATTLFAAD